MTPAVGQGRTGRARKLGERALRILVVLPAYRQPPPTGALVTTREYVRGLVAAGHAVQVVTTSREPERTRTDDGVKVWPLANWRYAVQKSRPQLIISHHGDWRAAQIIRQSRSVPHVLMVHGMSTSRDLGAPDHAWFPSQACRDHYHDYRGPAIVLPPPIDPARYPTTPGGLVRRCASLGGLSAAPGGRGARCPRHPSCSSARCGTLHVVQNFLAVAAATTNSNVAWAAAIGAGVAGLVTGVATIVVSVINSKAQRNLTKDQLDADARTARRELRRQAYADCVLAVEEFRDVIEPLGKEFADNWPVPHELTGEEEERLDNLLDRLRERFEKAFQRAQVVRIEGPAEMHTLIPQLTNAMGLLRVAAGDRVHNAKAGQPSVDVRAWNESAGELFEVLEEFITKASAVVEDPVS